MELITVKASDLTKLFEEISQLRSEVHALRENEENLKAYSIQQAADMLNLHYCSVRKLVVAGKLFAKYLNNDYGKCIIPFWALKAFLTSKENSNQNFKK